MCTYKIFFFFFVPCCNVEPCRTRGGAFCFILIFWQLFHRYEADLPAGHGCDPPPSISSSEPLAKLLISNGGTCLRPPPPPPPPTPPPPPPPAPPATLRPSLPAPPSLSTSHPTLSPPPLPRCKPVGFFPFFFFSPSLPSLLCSSFFFFLQMRAPLSAAELLAG